MIEEIQIKNFQSHKDTRLTFHPGFNSIIGTTDSGKSAIYRSLYWLRFNKATNFISFWNRNKEGDPVEETSAKISMDGKEIARIRSPEMNGYDVDGSVLEAIGRGEPPEKVTTLLNMSDINFFSQHNPPFLLTKTAGQVASILNELIHLDSIDTILSKLDSKKKSVNKTLGSLKETTETMEQKIASYSWLEQAKAAHHEVEALEKELGDVQSDCAALGLFLERMRKIQGRIEVAEKILDDVSPVIVEIEELEAAMKETMDNKNKLSKFLEKIAAIEANIEKLKAVDVTDEIEYCETIQAELEEVQEDIESLTDYVTQYSRKQKDIADKEKELAELELELPDECPICGTPREEWGEGRH